MLLEPVTLPCGHTLDKACLERHLASAPRRNCPECRARVPTGELPKMNVMIRQMVEQLYPRQLRQRQDERRRAWATDVMRRAFAPTIALAFTRKRLCAYVRQACEEEQDVEQDVEREEENQEEREEGKREEEEIEIWYVCVDQNTGETNVRNFSLLWTILFFILTDL